MCGIPGSGKSTVAEELKRKHNAIRISPDEIRRMLSGDTNDQSRNADVFAIAHRATESNLLQGNRVVFDATNTRPESRAQLLDLARQTGATSHLHIVNPGLDVCKQRNNGRERVVPADVLERMHGELVESYDGILNHEDWSTINHHG